MERDLPSGQVTLVLADIEGSTKLLHELGPEDYATALADHRRLLRDSLSRHRGVEVDIQGDGLGPDAAVEMALGARRPRHS